MSIRPSFPLPCALCFFLSDCFEGGNNYHYAASIRVYPAALALPTFKLDNVLAGGQGRVGRACLCLCSRALVWLQ
jgi:hypothetical protein